MKFITILICKILAFIGNLIGRGSSLPGAIALKICPNILSKLEYPEHIIAITGSNGKTSTVEMVANILTAAGVNLVYNKEGSNQTEGVATMLLKNSSLSGKVRGDVVLLESDERYAQYTFRHVKPSIFVITNLYRDQLTRNAHPYFIRDTIKTAVDLIPEAVLVLNADDPIVNNFSYNREKTAIYFGMDKNAFSSDKTDALYNDCFYCPVCKSEMHYDFFHYAHLGSYSCPNCNYSRHDPFFKVTDMDLESGTITISTYSNGVTIDNCKISLEFASKYNVYNICAAFATASILGISSDIIEKELNNFVMKNGRLVTFLAGENKGLLITSKHENSTSYNQSLSYITMQKEPSTLVILVDAISRKYYTAETSWLWDISFEMLRNTNVNRIILTGKYAYDLALRFENAGITSAMIITEPDLDKMAALIKEKSDNKLYAITCFSDKEKLLSRVTAQAPGVK